MNVFETWTLNVKGNALSALGKLAQGGKNAAAQFMNTSNGVNRMNNALNASNRSIDGLNNRLNRLTALRNRSFDPGRIEKFNKEIAKTQKQISKMEGMGTKGGGLMSGLGGGMGMKLGAIGLGIAIVQGIKQGIVDLVTTMKDFQKANSRVAAITGANAVDKAMLKASAMQVGSSTPFTAIEAANAQAYLGMAGFNSKQIVAALPATANLAMAGDLGLDRSADILSNILGQYQMQAGNAGKVAAVLAATATSSNTNIEQLAEAMKYLGPTAHSMNISLEETASIIGALGDAGIQGSMAGRALGTSLVNLAKPSKQQAEALKAVNLQAYNSNGQFVGMANLLSQLETGTANLTDKQKAAYISTIFGNEAFQELNILLAKGSEAFAAYTTSITGTNKAAEMAKIMNDNLAGDLDRMKSAYEGLILTIDSGDGAISRFGRSMTQWFTYLLNDIATTDKFGLWGASFKQDIQSMFSWIPGVGKEAGAKEARDWYGTKNTALSDILGSGSDAATKMSQLQEFGNSLMIGAPNIDSTNSAYAGYMQMYTELQKQVKTNLAALKDSKTVKAKGTEGGTAATGTPSAVESAISSVNGGGRQQRNVIVNITKLIENNNNYLTTAGGQMTGIAELEAKIQEAIIRGIRGAEEAAFN